MDLNLVKTNEATNKGMTIFLYLSDVSGQWVAYGQSAYSLRLYVKANGFDSLRAYSIELKMPCTVVSNKTVSSLRHVLKMMDEEVGQRVSFEVPDEVDYKFEEYLMWMEKLQKENRVTVSRLSKEYGVTEETIRRDLEKLEKDGIRTQLLLLILLRPDEQTEILKVAEHYFCKLHANWYMTSMFKKWCDEQGLEPEWFED